MPWSLFLNLSEHRDPWNYDTEILFSGMKGTVKRGCRTVFTFSPHIRLVLETFCGPRLKVWEPEEHVRKGEKQKGKRV